MTNDSAPAPLEILVAEDSPTQAEQLRAMLESNGFRVIMTVNGRDALAALRREKPTMVISDIEMPIMGGYDLCREIRADPSLEDLPIILLTFLSSPGDVFNGLECGADNFISKPCEEEYLMARIHYLLANRHLRRHETRPPALEVVFEGRRHAITADRLQILNLLLSTYETAVQKNRALTTTRDELRELNEQLEERVRRRTVALMAEVAERQKAEAAVRQLNEDLERRVEERTAELAAANQELDAFTYSVSHDLRAPLRAIDGFSTMLREDFGDRLPKEGLGLLARVTEGSRRMSRLIEDLLNFSRLGRLTLARTPVDLERLARETVESLLPEHAGRTIDVSIAALPPLVGDPGLWRQVMVNLLSNAFKFTRGRERATVEVGFRPADGENGIIYFIRDNGAGFDMNYSNKLFGVFQRLHRLDEFEGTGVGLSLVQRIINRHGGRIWAEAAVDQGATFYFTLGSAPT